MFVKLLFIIGVIVDAFAFILAVGNLSMISKWGASSTVSTEKVASGLTMYGHIMRWGMPIGLLAAILLGLWLKMKGRHLLANIIIWIPALPVLVGILIWGFLALVFILFSKP